MKKTSVYRIVSLILALILCLGLIACSKTDNKEKDDDDDDDKPSTETVERTDETRFAELKAAYEATLDYDGNITISAKQTQVADYTGEGYDYDERYNIVMSADFDKGIFYVRNEETNNSRSNSLEIEKGFVKDGVKYLYWYEKYDDEEPEVEYSKYMVGDPIRDVWYYTAGACFYQYAGGLFTADSYKELTDAFSTAFAALKENDIKYMKAEGLMTENTKFEFVPEVQIKEDNDGTVTLTITSKVVLDDYVNTSGEKGQSVECVFVREFSCNDGKISATKIDIAIEDKSDDVDKSKYYVVKREMEASYSFEYSFDEKGYDAIEVSLPTDPTDIYETYAYESNMVKINMGGIEYDEYVTADSTVDGMLEQLKESIESGYVDFEGENMIKCVNVKGFYKDQALTQKITASNITPEQMVKLESIYVDYEIRDGYAIVSHERETKMNVSRIYEIIYAELFYGASAYERGNIVRAGENIYISFEAERGADIKVTLNGVETTAETLVAESGKIYVINKISIFGDEDLGFEYVINLPIFS